MKATGRMSAPVNGNSATALVDVVDAFAAATTAAAEVEVNGSWDVGVSVVAVCGLVVVVVVCGALVVVVV